MLSVTIVSAEVFLGVSCQVTLLYVQGRGCSLGCHARCHCCMCRGAPGGVILNVTIACVGVYSGV